MTAGRAAMPRVLVDCDPGIDDAIALLMLSRLHHQGVIKLDAVTTVAGNCAVETTTANARFVLDAGGLMSVDVFSGAAGPLNGGGIAIDGRAYHGEDCLGGLNPAALLTERPAEAPNRIARWASTHGREPRWLLATGPLTNVALALKASPNLADGIDRMVLMGGAFGTPGGNIRPWAEFNFFADVESAAIVCESRLPLELVSLDVTERLLIGQTDIEALGETMAGRLLAASIEYTRRALGVEGCYMHDGLAATALINPDLFEWANVELEVDRSGPRTGRVREHASDSGKARATSVNLDGARSLMLRALERGGIPTK